MNINLSLVFLFLFSAVSLFGGSATAATVSESQDFSVTAFGSGGSTTSQLLGKVYPIKIVNITKSQADYKTPENTAAAGRSALLQHDLDWFYQSFTVEAAAQEKKMFEDAGLALTEKYKLVSKKDEEFITGKKDYKDGLLLFFEVHDHDIDGTITKGWSGFVQENGLWKATYKYSEDQELDKFDDVIYIHCVASYRFPPADFLEDSCWHGNDLTNFNKTGVVLDKRYAEDLTAAVFNGIDNGLVRQQFNDMPSEQLSMGGWIKADKVDHTARIIEIGGDKEDSTAIVLDPGKGLRFWIHTNGRRVERTTALDYDFHDQQWHHLYLTYDGMQMKLYVDAQLKDVHQVAGSVDSAPILNIGQRNALVNNGRANTFKGLIDDIQVYKKALTADEIMRKYANGTTQSL